MRNVEKLLTIVKVWSVDVNHYQTLNELKLEKHPDKTFIGRIAKGFDFLGYSFEPKGLSIAPKTLANFLERKTQLYEQGADVRRIGKYVRNWWRWVRAGVQISQVSIYSLHLSLIPAVFTIIHRKNLRPGPP